MAETDTNELATSEAQSANISAVTPEVIARRPRKVAGGMWGPVEVAALAIGAVALGAVILLYIFAVAPAGRELARNRSEADRLEAEKMSAKTKYGEITTTEAQVGKLLTSVDDFETRFLPPAVNGRAALYQRINSLILAYGLTNTTGPDYQTLESADVNKDNESDEERGRAKFRSLFPGIYVTMTVEGSYQNLRRFYPRYRDRKRICGRQHHRDRTLGQSVRAKTRPDQAAGGAAGRRYDRGRLSGRRQA
jgi:hypothetical protein